MRAADLSLELGFSTANILGVGVACLDFPGILSLVGRWSSQPQLRTILYVNAYCFNTACSDSHYQDILQNADLVYADGISVVWAGRFLNSCTLHKMTGADWIYNFATWAEARPHSGAGGLRVYLLGSRPGVARRARDHLQGRYSALEIVGTADGYFQDKSEAQVLMEIERSSPHVVFVGMGTPVQEKWIAAHREEISAPVCWAVGALFDYLAGDEARVPGWMYRLGLEWLWRLLVDPVGKWRRYLLGNPLFVYRVVRHKYLRTRT